MILLGKRLLLTLGLVIFTLVLPGARPLLSAQIHTREPFVVTSQLSSATPFNITLPKTTANGKPVRTVVIEFVDSDCTAAAGTTIIGVARLRVEFHGGFAFYGFPFEAPIAFSNLSEFASTQKTLIFADPGSRLDYGLSGAQPACTVVFSGYLISQ